jgi:1A family penicillin-binding protein
MNSFIEKIKKMRPFQKNHSHKRRIGQWFINSVIVLVSLGIFITGGIFVWASTLKIPDFQHFDQTLLSESTKIYDRTGKILLYDVHGNVRRSVVPLNQISPNVQHASIALEDSSFYSNPGIDITAIFRSALKDITSGSFSQGGSTITQQVAKNAFLNDNKSVVRKVKEAILALKIGHQMTKKQVLSIYLNIIPYGGNIYGIEEASETYFGIHAANLDIAQSAYLASLPKAPTYYSPYGNNIQALNARKNYALQRMLSLGYISQAQYDKAKNEVVTFAPRDEKGIKAPHFVSYVLANLEKKYGRDRIEQGGLNVITTLDYDLYEKSQKIVYDAAIQNEKVNNASNMGMVGIDPKTGQIILMIGSRDYFDKKINGKFNVTTSVNRQPGSTFKPFVYATAFEEGYTPSTIVFDAHTQFNTSCSANQLNGGCGYAPTNYDNKFRGPITFRDALAQSVNVPAVKVLYLTGIDRAITQARDMGISGLKGGNQYGLTLVLGGGEVSVLDMASAYGVFATGGIRNPYTSILKITDRNGNVLQQYTPNPQRVLDKQAALDISSILTDNVARTPLYGANSPLYFGGKAVAGKTGTTNNYVDAWTVGYDKNFSLAAWAGNNDNSPMAKKVSGYIITPTWRKVMDLAIAKYPPEPFEKPNPTPSNLKPILRGIWNPQNPNSNNQNFNATNTQSIVQNILNGGNQNHSAQNAHSILYWLDKNDPRGPQPTNPAADPQYNLWEPAVHAWLQNNGYYSVSTSGTGNNGNATTTTESFNVQVTSPQDGGTYRSDESVPVSVNSSGVNITKMDVYVNGYYVGSDSNAPFGVTFTPGDIKSIKKHSMVKILIHDSQGNVDIKDIPVTVN